MVAGAEADGSKTLDPRDRELDEGESRFGELFARSRDGFVVLDATGRFLDANPAYCAMVGYSLEELRALPGFLSITPKRWHHWETTEILGKRLRDRDESGLYDKEHIRRDGTVFPVEIQAYAARRSDGSLDRIWGIARDITDRKRAEQALRESEERWRAVFESSPMGIHLYRLAEGDRLIFEGANPAANRLTGIDNSRFVGRAIEEAFPALAATEIPGRYRRAAREGERWQTEQVTYGDESIRGAYSVCAFQISRNRMAAVFDDITARKRAEHALRESQDRLSSIVRVAPTGIGVVRGRVFTEVNARICEMTGYEAEELIGQSARVLYPTQEDYEYVGREEYRQIAERGTGVVETRWKAKDGSIRDVLLASTPLDPADHSRGVTFTALDITDRKRTEEALRESDELQRAIIGASPLAIISIDLERRVRSWNAAAERIFGWTAPEVLGRPLPYLWDAELASGAHAMMDRVLSGETFSQVEVVRQRKDGTPIEVSLSTAPVLDRDGRITALMASMEDITERKRIEEALQRTQFATDRASDSILWVGENGEITYANDAACTSMGYTREELLSLTVFDIDPDFPREGWEGHVAQMEREGRMRFESRHRAKDGRVFPVEVSTNYMPFAGRFNAVAFDRDISERKRVEAALREGEERYRALFDQSVVGIYLHRLDGQIVDVNAMASIQSGYSREELLQLNVLDLHTDLADRDFILADWAEWREGDRRTLPSELRRKDGSCYSVDVTTGAVRHGGETLMLAIVHDTSERRRAEEEQERLRSELVQAQKMESVGRLAGGVAHDFNNMLGVILGHAELALQQVDPSQELAASLREIRKAAERSADLTRQLLAFARKQTVAPKVVDLNEAVGAMLTMLRRLIGEAIDLVWLPCQSPCPVNMDPSQIDQVLANLCVNARDAISGTGKVTIETAAVAPGEAYSSEIGSLAPGEYVLLSVTDDGCGMDADTRSHLFEPFFTTKGVGQGTGLGLATVYGIIRQNEGFIDVRSEPSQGATFRIYLPRRPDEMVPPADEGAARPAAGGHETILLVEDEPTILELVQTMLEGQGYTVIAAGTPSEGLRLAGEYPGGIQLLITDVIMPEMNGLDLARGLLASYPGLRMLFMSGYTADVIAHHGVLDPGVCFLEKPFKTDALAAKVREALGRNGG